MGPHVRVSMSTPCFPFFSPFSLSLLRKAYASRWAGRGEREAVEGGTATHESGRASKERAQRADNERRRKRVAGMEGARRDDSPLSLIVGGGYGGEHEAGARGARSRIGRREGTNVVMLARRRAVAPASS